MIERAPKQEPKRHILDSPQPVEGFKSAARLNNPLLYPGERPDRSYLTDGETVYPMGVEGSVKEGRLTFYYTDAEGEDHDLNRYLEDSGVPVMEDRIPVLAYGANVCPASLASKFTAEGRDDLQIIPTLYGSMHGYDVVWSGHPGVKGNHIAQLYRGDETVGSEVQVAINFLTREQLLVMHSTELSYELALTQRVTLENGEIMPAFFYAGNGSVLLKDGQPVAIESIPAEGRAIASMETAEALEYSLAPESVQHEVSTDERWASGVSEVTPGTYVGWLAELTLPERRAIQKKLDRALLAEGLQGDVSIVKSLPQESLRSWANPSTLPTLGDMMTDVWHHEAYRLPVQEMPIDKWQVRDEDGNPDLDQDGRPRIDSDKRNRVLKGVGTHLMRMLDLEEKK